MTKGKTISLQMIVKDEFDQVAQLVTKAQDCNAFNEINLTVSDKTTVNKLKKLFGNEVNVVWRTWTDRFDEARNDNYAMSTTDYTFWLDADDDFDFSTIPEILDIAVKNDIDAIFLPYNYAQDENGNCITRHWRERLVKNGKGFSWRGWVHETYISDEPYTSHKVNVEVVHNADPSHAADSVERNHDILVKAYEAEKDPRYLHYLGMSYFTHGEYNTAAELLSEYLEVGGSLEDTYRALAVLSECAYHLKQHDLALEYATKCATLKPEYPQAYWLLAQYEADQNNWEEALEWIRVSETKPDPQTLSVWDPSSRERAALIGAQSEFMLGNYNAALAWLRKIPNNPQAKELYEDFQNEADAETFVKLLPKIIKFFASPVVLWKALAPDLQYDTRLLQLRQAATTPTKWDDNSVVIFCGQGYEEWGPHTLDKGMGGSEEAVVYLSQELYNLGYKVTVYGEHDSGLNSQVVWRHWKEIDLRDDFNIFISWRTPQYLEKVKAKRKLCDLHDVMPEELVKDYPDVTYLVKSQYHRDLYPHLPDSKFRIIGNGIKKEQFHE
jgi:tetratricopeptide (TPR) repeat protein